MARFRIVTALLVFAIVALALSLLLVGTVDVPAVEVWRILTGRPSDYEPWNFIIFESRLPLVVTAALAGGALAVSGLLLQTLFGNTLADPSILGISTGASLGAGCAMLAFGSSFATVLGVAAGGYVATLTGAFVGAMVVMALLLVMSNVVKSSTMLLIVGILIGYIASSAISLLNFFATEEGVHSFVIWGLGNFSGVTLRQLPVFAAVVVAGLAASLLLIKPLNALLLGRRYAENLGVNASLHAQCAACGHRTAYSRCHGILRSYRIYRTCGAPRVASAAPHVRPLPVDSSGYPCRRGCGDGVHAGECVADGQRNDSYKCNHADCRCAGDTLRDNQPP